MTRPTLAELDWPVRTARLSLRPAEAADADRTWPYWRRLDVRRWITYCFADNAASVRLMERIGLRRESHTVKDSLHRSGEWLDGYGYALTADEWAGRT